MLGVEVRMSKQTNERANVYAHTDKYPKYQKKIINMVIIITQNGNAKLCFFVHTLRWLRHHHQISLKHWECEIHAHSKLKHTHTSMCVHNHSHSMECVCRQHSQHHQHHRIIPFEHGLVCQYHLLLAHSPLYSWYCDPPTFASSYIRAVSSFYCLFCVFNKRNLFDDNTNILICRQHWCAHASVAHPAQIIHTNINQLWKECHRLIPKYIHWVAEAGVIPTDMKLKISYNDLESTDARATHLRSVSHCRTANITNSTNFRSAHNICIKWNLWHKSQHWGHTTTF